MLAYKPQLKPLARRLRAAMTDAEHRLWFRLRRKQLLGAQFYRQKPIGKYIVDFYPPGSRFGHRGGRRPALRSISGKEG